MEQNLISIAIVAGTRPEIIKLAPVYLACKAEKKFKTNLILTGQHRDLVLPFLEVFNISPEIDLGLTHKNALVGDILGKMIAALSAEFEKLKPNFVVVQGDTSSALAGALAAFHLKIPIGHVEAGLRTNNIYSPFPEEMNRVLISKLAALHFAPTKGAINNLTSEGIVEGVFLTGNSGVDALNFVKNNLGNYKLDTKVKELLDSNDKFILSTFHRRENQEGYFLQFLELLRLVVKETGLKIVIPVHLSPNVKDTIHSEFSDDKNIILLPPVDYPNLIALMNRSRAIISDSGGIQEEAPSLKKHVFITRTSTERPEVIESGYGELLDLSNPVKGAKRIKDFLDGSLAVANAPNPFGDGTTSAQIVRLIFEKFA
jgi:UDP-N-acetylglucosamine 2-epimerase (non-hydrolysing)